MQKLSNSSSFMDIGGIDSLRAKALKDDKAALKEVAQLGKKVDLILVNFDSTVYLEI